MSLENKEEDLWDEYKPRGGGDRSRNSSLTTEEGNHGGKGPGAFLVSESLLKGGGGRKTGKYPLKRVKTCFRQTLIRSELKGMGKRGVWDTTTGSKPLKDQREIPCHQENTTEKFW